MSTLLQDLRYAARMLLKHPGFTLVALLTLALGIGANTAIFSFVHAVLLRPLPYPQPDRLLFITETRPALGDMSLSYPNFVDWRAGQHAFEDLAGYRRDDFNLTGDGEPERIRGAFVTASFFKVMGLAPILGRPFLESEDQPGAAPVIVLSERLWRGRFGADPKIVGRKLTLNSISYEVVGIAPAELTTPRGAELYAPLGFFADRPYLTTRGNHPGFYALGRLKPGVSLTQGAADLAVVCRNLEAQYPDSNTGMGAKLRPLLESAVGQYRATLWLLLGAVGFVLLIACANVANLSLARAVGRRREIALRAALGASRGRIIAQLLTESVLLAVLGGGLGLLVALWSTDAIGALVPRDVPRFQQVRVDGVVLAFMAAITLGTGLLFGLLPAWKVSQTDPNTALKEAGGHSGTAGASRQRSQALLVVGQVALACVLLVGAGLLIQSFRALQQVRLGFEPHGLLNVGLKLPGARYRDQPNKHAAIAAFHQRLLEAVQALPGVQVAAICNNPPFGGRSRDSSFAITGRPDPKPGEEPSAEALSVSPDYFKTMGIPILRGRSFDASDTLGKPKVVLIDESFARRYFPGQDPLGQQINDNEPVATREQFTIIGIVPTVRHGELSAEPKFVQMYSAAAQDPELQVGLLIRAAAGNPLALTGAVRAAVLAVDPELPVFDVRSMDAALSETLATRRLSVVLIGLFSGLALLLAALGLYGVLAYAVAQRTREIGIRLALGAAPGNVFRLIVRRGMGMVATGLALGLLATLALTRLLASFLFGVGANDPATLGSVALTLAAVAFLACWLPARRAMRIEPIAALREE